MRPIKFRAYDPVRKMMFYFGRTSDNEQMHTEDNQCSFDGEFRGIIFHSMYDADNDALYELDYDSRQLMQFTGLYDKNGKEIYEGDIVLVKNCYQETFIVGYSPPMFLLYDDKDGCLGEPEITWEDWKDFEIIGNIHENKQ